jgi:hypothetical protein
MKKRMAKRMMDAEEGPLREGAAQMTYEELNKAEPKVVGAYFNDFYALFPTSNKLVEARVRTHRDPWSVHCCYTKLN